MYSVTTCQQQTRRLTWRTTGSNGHDYISFQLEAESPMDSDEWPEETTKLVGFPSSGGLAQTNIESPQGQEDYNGRRGAQFTREATVDRAEERRQRCWRRDDSTRVPTRPLPSSFLQRMTRRKRPCWNGSN